MAETGRGALGFSATDKSTRFAWSRNKNAARAQIVFSATSLPITHCHPRKSWSRRRWEHGRGNLEGSISATLRGDSCSRRYAMPLSSSKAPATSREIRLEADNTRRASYAQPVDVAFESRPRELASEMITRTCRRWKRSPPGLPSPERPNDALGGGGVAVISAMQSRLFRRRTK